ncbi:hypothetical protein CEP54_008316 [Fusarium duplospermum]|uniref:Uncharacterized protein n=1 Tax=Fusarium duplospermum TaxID=1325734 RepID=A0A428PWE6_9HYPO|nr:hypothetical protein CEP54_008316 [Fusarium duplospermum]
MSEVRILFEYPQIGPDVVSQAAPVVPGVPGPTYGPDPEVTPYDDDSGSDSEDYESDGDYDDSPVIHSDWHPHAINFLAQVPQSDAAWSRYLNSNGDVHSLCYRLRLPFLYPGFHDDMDWERLFKECTWHLARACKTPGLATLFSLIFLAACHVGLVNGCPREIVLDGVRQCVRQCGLWEYELTVPMLDRLREGAVKGIMLLTEYTRVIGSRAHELPLYTSNCLQLFIRCTPACITYVKSRIPFTYRPTTPLQSDCLEITSLVYTLLGGSKSKWQYQDICKILQPEGVPLPLYKDICMADVLEYDESEDEGTDDFGGYVPTFKNEFSCAFRHPLGELEGKASESFETQGMFL